MDFEHDFGSKGKRFFYLEIFVGVVVVVVIVSLLKLLLDPMLSGGNRYKITRNEVL